MARNRLPGEAPIPPSRGPTQTPLSLLLRSRRFRVAVGADRVAAQLQASGGQIGADAAAWVGASAPPVDAPTLSLGPHAGTLGPRSYGFLNNTQPGAVAALDLPAGPLPRNGRLAVVVPGRDALPDLLPLFVARELPISWLISVGDGDPSEVLTFLSEDPSTDAIAIALGPEVRATGLRSTLGAKPTVVLGGDTMCRAVARRAGAHVVDRIGEWLAIGALLGTGDTLEDPVEIWIAGGGEAWVRGELARYTVDAMVRVLDERDPHAISAAIEVATSPRLAIVIGAGVTLPASPEGNQLRLVAADTRQPEQVSRLLKAVGAELERRRARPQPDDAPQLAAPVDGALAARVRAEVDGALSDHDAKRLLKAWGIKVTRQGPTGTPTGAVKLARMIGLPSVIARGDEERIADTLPEVRRLAALLLEPPEEEGSPRSVMIRERYPDVPRAKVRIGQERGIGMTMKIGDAVALLPLDGAEALHLAQRACVRRAADQKTLAALLVHLGTTALTESATFELDLYLGPEPTVLKAVGSLKRG